MKRAPERRLHSPRRESGLTLVEILIAVAVLGVIVLAVVELFSPLVKFFQRSQARSQANMQARICMETIDHVMSNGMPSTLVISTPPTTPSIPFSTAQFVGVDGSTYTLCWSTAPVNSIHLQRIPPGSGGVTIDTVLATNVTELNFLEDLNNPGIVHVTLQMIVPLDSSGTPGSLYTIFLSNQTILMSST